MIQCWLYRWRNSARAARSSVRSRNRRIHKSCSFRVRKKRSMHPFPSGWRTNAGEGSMPRKRISFLELVAHVDAAMVVTQAEAGCATAGKASEILLNTLADRLQGFEPARFLYSMGARVLRRGVVGGGQ